ncbi:MAG: bifunctional sterol desaturase/short chain dehydrogenase [Leptolyngbyaceae cyanobacterium SM1_1_3]|nr:bifunctional sterol desaturase/short chain dehydrogenase [Leptolyngbyaceae cyanobacterium SM1_1_3]NJM84939.1 bifunctional sterol desaturase/short chain dehydrogenase [Leptolyngbyaceae cyanobacterium RM2_2_21]NJN04938.1 bifunctional sterol desaturase/short chain dehydrogenase [Leptolyngbyaceae cyanobacterium RM1_1_2]NJO11355.1 bifunctional sterol desaturase/short chain dehydrogenase [Leptolyngbyaceae cyanobacterium SL_1_1]
MELSSLVVQVLWGISAVMMAEMIRDVYHLASHQWGPLQYLHSWHHKAYKRDFTPISADLYARAQLYNDVPESLFMMAVVAGLAIAIDQPGLWLGFVYAAGFLGTAIARSQGWLLLSDLTHKPGPLTEKPSNWVVNRTYHWRHHFDNTQAYYAGYFTFLDKLMGSAVSLKGKTIAVTGASGTMGQALIAELKRQGAKPIAMTTSPEASWPVGLQVLPWCPGAESDLQQVLKRVDILIINHGLNVHGDRSPSAIETSLQVNALSAWKLAEVFMTTVKTSAQRANKEIWFNTSEAEVSPAFSPLYEVSKRLLGDLITLRRLDSPCVIRKVILGPFKSNLNPIGVMSAGWVAKMVVTLAKRNVRNIIVTVNPLTYLAFPLKEASRSLYFRLFSKRQTK